MQNINYECAIITGATPVLMREAFTLWNRGGEAYGDYQEYKVIVCVTMYNATTMMVFYHTPLKSKTSKLSKNCIIE